MISTGQVLVIHILVHFLAWICSLPSNYVFFLPTDYVCFLPTDWACSPPLDWLVLEITSSVTHFDHLLRYCPCFFDCPIEKTLVFRSGALFGFADLSLMVSYCIGACWIWSHQRIQRFSEHSSFGAWEGWNLRAKVSRLTVALAKNTWMESREEHCLASTLTLLVSDWQVDF